MSVSEIDKAMANDLSKQINVHRNRRAPTSRSRVA